MATRRKSSSSAESSGRKKSFLHRGTEGRKRMEQEIAASKKRREASGNRGPNRFFVPRGEEKEIVILDDAPDVFGYEHTLRGPNGKFTEHVTCVKETENCQACEEVGDSSYVLYLSVLDLTEFTDRKGVTHDFSRKLMVVKQSQMKKFIRRFEKSGTLRGAVFECARDDAQMSAAIGNDIEFIEFMDEDELMEDYIRTWKDKDGKKHTENCGEVYEYEDVIAPPSAEAISAILGEKEVAGSRKQSKKELDEDSWDDDEEDTPWDDEDEEEEKPKTRKRGKAAPSRRRRKIVEEEDDESTETEEEEEEKPRRRKVNKPARRRRKPAEEEEEEEEEAEEEKPRRRRSRRK